MTTAWLFPGQGSQSSGMGRVLLLGDACEARVFARAEAICGLPLRRLSLEGDAGQLRDCRVLEPLLAAFGIADVERLRQGKARPRCVAGYSAGELVALYAAEVLALDDVLALAAQRGRVMQAFATRCPGRMSVIVGLSGGQVTELVGGAAGAYLAGWNGADHMTVAGSEPALRVIEGRARAAGAIVMPLEIAAAWHSPLAASAADRMRELLADVVFRPARVPVYGAVTGRAEVRPDALRHSLWSHVARPVLWEAALRNLIAEQGVRLLVAMGAGRGLAAMVRRHTNRFAPDVDIHVFSSPLKEHAHA